LLQHLGCGRSPIHQPKTGGAIEQDCRENGLFERGQVVPAHEFVDPVHDHGALGANDVSFIVGKERAACESPTGGQPAQAIGKPVGHDADIVVDQQPAAGGGDHQVASAAGPGQDRRVLAVD